MKTKYLETDLIGWSVCWAAWWCSTAWPGYVDYEE